MDLLSMKLIRPCEEYLDQYKKAVEENCLFRPQGETTFADPDRIIELAYNQEQGINLPQGYVKATTFWSLIDNRFIGQISIRHELTDNLLRYGGHIGYEVRYSENNKGYGTRQLALALDYVRGHLPLDKVLITCDDDNPASARVIEKNGGILENKETNYLDEKGRRILNGGRAVLTRRYWISL